MPCNLRTIILQMFLCMIPVTAIEASVINGSFDSPGLPPGQEDRGLGLNESSFITGWLIVPGYDGTYSGGVEYVHGFSQDDGGYSVELGAYFGINGIEQAFASLPGQQYLVTFWLVTDPFNGPPARLRASAGGTTADFLAAPGTGNGENPGWQEESFFFTSDGSGSTTLLFENLPEGSTPTIPAIDTITVTAVPEPSSIPIIVLAITAFLMRKDDAKLGDRPGYRRDLRI